MTLVGEFPHSTLPIPHCPNPTALDGLLPGPWPDDAGVWNRNDNVVNTEF